MTCASIITTISRQLVDVSAVTWPAATLLDYLNIVIREIIDAKPEANPVTQVVTLAAGTRQALPSGAVTLINVRRNMGTDGLTPGLTITEIDRKSLDSSLPDWPMFPTDPEVRYCIFDDRDPLAFDVFPPQPAGTTQHAEITTSNYPTYITDSSAAFPLPPDYANVSVHGVLYWALHEETTIPNALAKAETSRTHFYQALGVKTQADAKVKAEGQ